MTGLYIHIPFCEKRCYYCDFSTAKYRQTLVDKYLTALHAEIDLFSKYRHISFQTLFLGGGTPSLLSEKELANIFDHLYTVFQIDPKAEISCETNPETLTPKKLAVLYDLGINRLSIGIQSFHDHHLQKIGRIHSAKDAIEAYYFARDVCFKNINIDLMFALPNQTIRELEHDLDRAIQLQPEHISAYSLTIEEKTVFGKQYRQSKLQLVDEEIDAQMYEKVMDRLTEAGYKQYEISNFAKIGYECHHNFVYWNWGDYLGIGAGSHSHFSASRWANQGNTSKYVKLIAAGESPIVMKEMLSIEQQMSEFIFLALRTMAGLDIQQFEERFNISIDELYSEVISDLSKRGLIDRTENRIFLTKSGIILADMVCSEFMVGYE